MSVKGSLQEGGRRIRVRTGGAIPAKGENAVLQAWKMEEGAGTKEGL